MKFYYLPITNREAERVLKSKNKAWNLITIDEILCFLGIYVLSGVERDWDVPVRELFCNEFANPWYRASMAENRFNDIKRFLRFDDKNTRPERGLVDKLAPIRNDWEMFIINCKAKYSVGADTTIDEQLLGFRGRCKFIQYIPSKPDKYGIKIFWLCDAKNTYALNGLVDVGKQPDEGRRMNFGHTVVMELAKPIYDTGRNITMDNFFTSLMTCEDLIKKNCPLLVPYAKTVAKFLRK